MTRSRSLFVALAPLFALLVGCGGSEATSALGDDLTGITQDFGSLTTRTVGTAQSPVLSSGYGSIVIGVAGATFSDISQSYVTKNLANTRIAFHSSRDGNYEIYVMNADGTGQTRLTSNTTYDVSPSWSPDGTKIAYNGFPDGIGEIYSMNADGTGQTRLTNNTAGDYSPSWSPNGTKIAFYSDRDGNYEIYVMNANGTGQTRLTNNAAVDSQPSWSPDSTKIVFNSNRDGNTEIYSMNAVNGADLTRLTSSAAIDSSPSWSPDGTRIAFYSDRDGNYEIYSMNPNGTGLTRLTNNAAGDYTPSWSPDSTRIIFVSSRDGNTEIYSMNADGTGLMRLTNNTVNDGGSSWSGFWRPKYVGAGGILGTSCAGFLLGKQGQVNASLLVFDTPTVAARTTARVDVNTNLDTNGPNLAFTITTTTGLSSLKFINKTQSFTPVVPALPVGTTSALVLFDSGTGFVTDVIPYTANRSVPSHSGSLATYTGHFTAIFDSTGKNLAPGGAKSVTLDEKTGRLVRFE